MAEYAGAWRDIGHAKWYDPLAALEDTNSPHFAAAVAAEDAHWSDGLQHTRLPFWRRANEEVF